MRKSERESGESCALNRKKEKVEKNSQRSVNWDNTGRERNEEQKLQRKCHEAIEWELKFRCTTRKSEHWFSDHGGPKDAKLLHSALMTAADSMIHKLIYIHATMLQAALSSFLWSAAPNFTSPSISLYLPLHPMAENLFGFFYNPQISGQASKLGCFFILYEFYQS